MARRPHTDSDEPGAFSTLREPVGPQNRSVYIRRRIFVLLGFLAVVLTIVLVIVKPGSESPKTDSQKVEVPGDLTEKPKQPVGGDTPACELDKLVVTALTDQATYGPDELPRFSLQVKNTGDAACVAELGTGSMSFTVASGADEVWRSKDCQVAGDKRPVILEADEQLETDSIQWDRTRSSAESCEIARDPVVSGGASYHLTAGAGGATSRDTAQFLLY